MTVKGNAITNPLCDGGYCKNDTGVVKQLPSKVNCEPRSLCRDCYDRQATHEKLPAWTKLHTINVQYRKATGKRKI